MMYIHYSSDSKTVQLTCLASCSPSHHASCPFLGYMMTWALVFVLKYPSCTTITFCSSSVRVNCPSWVMKSKTWIDHPWPFLWSGCWPSGTQTLCWYSFVWKILSSWKIGMCSFPMNTDGTGSITSLSYSHMSLAMIQPFNNYQTSDVHTFQYHHLLKITSNTLFSTWLHDHAHVHQHTSPFMTWHNSIQASIAIT